jgi:hypothetical protein
MNNNKQQTVVEWLQLALVDTILTHEQVMQTIGLFEQAKEIEKERMKGMYVEGSFAKMRYYDGLEYIDAEQYYNETYGDDKQ